MKVRLQKMFIAGGAMTMLLSSSLTFANMTMFSRQPQTDNYSLIKPDRIAGETPETLEAYKRGCPDCVKVASDVAQMRTQFCRTKNTVNTVIAGDPIYGYLNGIRMVLQSRGGYASPVYSTARQVLEANVDCQDSQNWIDRSQRVMNGQFNAG
ncbi:hypothetical protein HGT70_14375 [Rosenbergiella collisarenosi]|uniref:hypothetical protein n=1 Tax=Rosenbergiella collisarenosi TaxID=1544695 RepID=UPI001BD9A835|nr:hypothetical protein [Rosenbergiella collisarenosi]MBT0722460.1 hypothetical protein [Rosenbergiella collisarenosi]